MFAPEGRKTSEKTTLPDRGRRPYSRRAVTSVAKLELERMSVARRVEELVEEEIAPYREEYERTVAELRRVVARLEKATPKRSGRRPGRA